VLCFESQQRYKVNRKTALFENKKKREGIVVAMTPPVKRKAEL